MMHIITLQDLLLILGMVLDFWTCPWKYFNQLCYEYFMNVMNFVNHFSDKEHV